MGGQFISLEELSKKSCYYRKHGAYIGNKKQTTFKWTIIVVIFLGQEFSKDAIDILDVLQDENLYDSLAIHTYDIKLTDIPQNNVLRICNTSITRSNQPVKNYTSISCRDEHDYENI